MSARITAIALSLTLLTSGAFAQTAVPSPSNYLKMSIGADRVLADYDQMEAYFRALAESSPRVVIEDLGPTTLGDTMIMAVISSEQNIANREKLREISARLADPRGLTDQQIQELVAAGRPVVLVTCNIHSSEIASSQMAMEWAYSLATANDEEIRRRLDDVVILLVPSLNPDGQKMIVDWYRKHLGTEFEGGPMPWLYHQYAGHDNNRDWFMLTQNETRALTRMLYHEWFPQIFVDVHQMGSYGPRMFIPPFADPLDPDVHPLIWREIALIGSNMAYRLEQKGREGLISGYAFDAYWMGGTRNTGWWKNVTGLLLEVASARIATPIYIDPSELRGGSKGLVDYAPQVNHPNPWEGGWWRLRDIMDYQRIALDALVETASKYRTDVLRDVATRARDAVREHDPDAAYRIPAKQRDYPTARRLAQLVADHGVDVYEHETGDFWIPMAQPYSRFVTELLEPQRYPEVRLVDDAGILDPYDVSTWTLPLMMGVEVERAPLPDNPGAEVRETLLGGPPSETVDAPAAAEWTSIDAVSPEAARVVNAALAAGATVLLDSDEQRWWFPSARSMAARKEARSAGVALSFQPSAPADLIPVARPAVAIYKPWNASMDEGWTRWLLEQYGFEPVTLDNAAIRDAAVAGSAAARRLSRFDAIILPDVSTRVIATGRSDGATDSVRHDLPTDYRGGLGTEGAAALRKWVENGGTLIALASSTEWLASTLALPVRNEMQNNSAVKVPGSLLRADVREGHFITAGMPDTTAIFVNSPFVFRTSVPSGELDRTILVSYPDEGRDILLSGWMEGEDELERGAAAVAWEAGKGKAVMFGFRPQHRAQTHATLPLLFHSIWWSTAGDEKAERQR